MTKAEYTKRAQGYYENRLRRATSLSKQKGPPKFISVRAIALYRIVQAGIMASAPGRQNSKTRGWNEAALQAHRRAAALLHTDPWKGLT